MKKEDLKASFEQIKPSESAKKRMLENILDHSYRKKGRTMLSFNFKKVIPALALSVVIAGGLLTYSMLQKNYNYNSMPESNATDSADTGREDLAAPILNQFQIDDKLYVLLSDDLRQEFGFPATVNEADVGEKIGDIENSPDKSLIGSEVYKYIPAGGESVVAVKRDNGYQLFKFFTFESYNNNQDEDAIRYLTLYGIDSADDIAKIQFVGHSERGKLEDRMEILAEITDRDEITRFYDFYSALKNSSDKYFDKLFNYSEGTDIGRGNVEVDTAMPDIEAPDKAVSPDGSVEQDVKEPDQIGSVEDLPKNITPDTVHYAEDMPLPTAGVGESGAVSADTPVTGDTSNTVSPSRGMMDTGETMSGTVEANPGTSGEALANPITIRIYNKKGVYFDSIYYMNIGFISRYEVSEDFANFIGKYIK